MSFRDRERKRERGSADGGETNGPEPMHACVLIRVVT